MNVSARATRLLATGEGYTSEQIERLVAAGYDVLQRAEIHFDELLALLPTIGVYILGGNERLDRSLLAIGVHLRLVSFVGTGYGAFIDEAAAREQGITIRSTPDIVSSAVAEHTVGLLLGLVRGLFSQSESVKRSRRGIEATAELRDTAVGIVGMGSVGSRVAHMLVRGFDCRVFYHSRTRKPLMERELGLTFMELDQLVAKVDALVLLVPTAPDTVDLIDSRRLRIARRGLLLINTAGARLVDASALKAAIEDGRVRAAAFDGYWVEPLPLEQPDRWGFLDLPDDRFIVTPHAAAKTHSGWPRMIAAAVANVLHARISEPA